MECWKQDCKNKVKVFCRCVEPPSFSCEIHIYKHFKVASIKEHKFEHFKLKPNQKHKEALIEELCKLSKEMLDIKENLIKETYKKIQELELSLIESLKRIDKIRLNQVDLIKKIDSVKKIRNINQNPFEELLSLDPDIARKKLNEFGCSFNCSDFELNKNYRINAVESNAVESNAVESNAVKSNAVENNAVESSAAENNAVENNAVENNEIVFFRQGTKNSVRVNLTDFSKSEQQIDILQNNVKYSSNISMCLLPDKSIFCYGNYPVSGAAFILYPNSTIKQLSDGDPSAGMGSVHHDGFIYLFGGWDAYGNELNKAAKYELSTDKWYKICPLNEVLSRVSCIAGNYGIAFVGYESSKLYLYHHKQDIYNEIYLKFAANTNKVLLQAENRVLLIESGKNIYESESNQLTNWKIIGAAQISFGRGVAYKVYFNQSCYFMDNNDKLYKFDMKSLQLTMNQL